MAKDTLETTSFFGGISPFDKISISTGVANSSFKNVEKMDVHKDPSSITLMPSPSKVSGSTVEDLVKWAVDTSPYATDRYFYDEAGNLYKETSGGTWSKDRATATIGNGAGGQGLAVFDDFLYYTTSTTLGRKGYLSGTPAYDDDFLTDGTTNVDQSGGGTGATDYTPPTSISETATNKQTFTPTRDPLKAIIIDVDVVGTGDWTVTVHDSNDVSIGSATIANGSMTTGDVTFTFSTPLRVKIDNSYHFHVTSTVADGGVDTSTNNDLEAAEFSTLFGILIADTDWHPIQEHLNFLAIGNANYIAKWDQATYNPNLITLKAGFKVRNFTKWNEYLVAGCWQGDSFDNVESARLYYWSGLGTTFDFFDDLPMGLPDAIFDDDGELIGIYGDKGAIHIRGSTSFSKINRIPSLARTKKLEVYPSAITKWREHTMVGAGITDDSTFKHGVYEYGTAHAQLSRGLTYAFEISTGTTQSTGVKIGMVKGFGKDLYIGWEDNATYGVDKVSRDDNAVSAGAVESLIFDNGSVQKEKLALRLVITFEGLASGESITPKYKIDRTSSFTTGTAQSTVGATRAELVINKRFREIEFGFNVASSSNTYPIITGMWFEFDDLKEEDSAS